MGQKTRTNQRKEGKPMESSKKPQKRENHETRNGSHRSSALLGSSRYIQVIQES
jgi:hypothetical protein